MCKQNAERIRLLRAMVPELFSEPGTVLYIGAYDGRFAASGELYRAGNEITVIEIWPPFLEKLKACRLARRVAHFVEGDVTEVDGLSLPHERYTYTVWLHGPEHIGCHLLASTVKKLEALTTGTVVMGCPWGYVPHGVVQDNPHTQHRCYLYPEHFQHLRYRVAAIGPKNRAGSHLLAWKQKR